MKIIELEIKNFRGVKYIKLKPDGENLVVFGINGTGKSAIVDAIDFLLTGDISKLSGEGSKNLGIKEHGCHVDSRGNLKESIVNAKIRVNDKDILLERSIKNPPHIKVTPIEEEDNIKSLLSLASQGQNVLSRKEILKYITAEAGKRAKEIQSLLNLTNIEHIRTILVAVRNEAQSLAKITSINHDKIQKEICALVGLSEFSEDSCLTKINEFRATLKGESISKLSQSEIKSKLAPYIAGLSNDSLTIIQIENTIKQIKEIQKNKESLFLKESELRKTLEEIKKEQRIQNYTIYKKMIEGGIRLLENNNLCPLCGRVWEKGDFKLFLEERKSQMEIAEDKRIKVEQGSITLKKNIELLKNNLNTLVKAHKQFELKTINEVELNENLGLLASYSDSLDSPIESYENNKFLVKDIKSLIEMRFIDQNIITPLEKALNEQGRNMNTKQIAWDTLTKLEDKVNSYILSKKEKIQNDCYEKRSESLLSSFEKSRDSVLNEVFNNIKGDFEKYYKTIHSTDEGNFTSKISHVGPELTIEVDFYGRGMFPPQALHSEGHQDSMGLCLFLALNNYLSADKIKIIVLDDAVMSIDTSHRRETCVLLKKFFSDRQIIITTHDSAWAKQLKSEGIVKQKNMIHFVNWNIDTGPIFEMDKDLWARVDEDLKRGDVSSAAHKIRRDAECFFEELCESFNSKISYKGNHRWDLGDFAAAAISSYKEYLRKARKNSEKINAMDKVEEIKKMETKANEIISKTQIEQWIINENVHYNKWDQYSASDFKPIVDAFKELFNLFSCDSCGATIFVSFKDSKEGRKEILSCNCGKIFFNIE